MYNDEYNHYSQYSRSSGQDYHSSPAPSPAEIIPAAMASAPAIGLPVASRMAGKVITDNVT